MRLTKKKFLDNGEFFQYRQPLKIALASTDFEKKKLVPPSALTFKYFSIFSSRRSQKMFWIAFINVGKILQNSKQIDNWNSYWSWKVLKTILLQKKKIQRHRLESFWEITAIVLIFLIYCYLINSKLRSLSATPSPLMFFSFRDAFFIPFFPVCNTFFSFPFFPTFPFHSFSLFPPSYHCLSKSVEMIKCSYQFFLNELKLK